jgi:hypothetical protein
MTDIMIDLETLGLQKHCTILSIGACAFDRDSGNITSTFSIDISRTASEFIGFREDPETLKWWNNQCPEAKALLQRCDSPTDSELPHHAAERFVTWFNNTAGKNIKGVWANEPTFDCEILSHFLTWLKKETPWHFRHERSCRTIVDLGRELGIDPKKDMPFTGTPHNAKDDAIHQAKYVSAIFQHIKNNH